MRAINHFAVSRAALCGQHVLFLTARRCFDDGWQSSMSGSCLLTSVIGGSVSEPVGMSEQPNYEGVENAKPMLRGVSKDGASLPFLSKLPRTPASSAKHLQTCTLEDGACRQAGRGKEEASAGRGPMHSPILALGRRHCCSLTKTNLNWRA